MIPDTLLPEQYKSKAFIAGGFAACPSLAGDMDVWVLAPYEARLRDDTIPFDDLRVHVWLQERRQELLAHLKANFAPWRLDEHTDVRIVKGDDPGESTYTHDLAHVTLKVARIQGFKTGLPVHLMVCDASFPRQVIDGFDISTHSVALVSNEGVIRGSSWTPITDEPVILRANDKTPERIKKITERYHIGKR